MSGYTVAKQLKTSNTVRTYQREWLAKVREKVSHGGPFAICNGDEFEEIFNIMDIPVMVINYWNALIGQKRMVQYYSDVLIENGYPAHVFAMGLATTLDNNREIAPWGGLPKPVVIIGGTKYDREMKILELWAREYGCTFFPLEFGIYTLPDEKLPPPRWWEMIKDHWDEIIEPYKLDYRVEEEKALIRFLENTTGKKFSLAKLSQAMELINEQMEYWKKAHDLIAGTIPCPVSLRDQLAMYQIMWHRGTPQGRDFLKVYYEEIKERVDNGVVANPNEKFRLMWLLGTPPAWGQWAEEKYGAVCVASSFSGYPVVGYPRTILNNDPLRALAGRHMVMALPGPEFQLEEAKQHNCNGVIQVGPALSKSLQYFEEAGMPICELPYDRDDDKVRSIISSFIESRLLPLKR